MDGPRICAIHVGEPRELRDARGRTYRSALVKRRIDGPVPVGHDNLAGDRQADLRHHGGPDKALCVYPTAHLPYWRNTLERPDLDVGAFGENLSLTGTDEDAVAIGDSYAVGDAIVQVSQPRAPCWKLARRWNERTLPAQVQTTGYTGWYLRVLTAGTLAPGQPLTLLDRPNPTATIAAVNRARWHTADDLEVAADLAACPELAPGWREHFYARLEQHPEPDHTRRLHGDQD